MVNKEKTICGKSLDVIRKAFFSSKIPQLLDEIQAEAEWKEKDIEKLGFYLEVLKKENKEFVGSVENILGDVLTDDKKPPSVEDLRVGMSDADWREKADKAIAYVDKTLDAMRQNVVEKKNFSNNFWFDTFQTLISLESTIYKDIVFKEQKFNSRITEIIDKYNVSRKEAEDRAKLTQEYFEYKTLSKLPDRLKEVYTFLRRKDDENNHR